jgi:hypothetical protein
MRIFTPKEEMELLDGERLVGIYLPGLRYNCLDDNGPLSAVLDQWIADGKAEVIESRDESSFDQVTMKALLSGIGEVI